MAKTFPKGKIWFHFVLGFGMVCSDYDAGTVSAYNGTPQGGGRVGSSPPPFLVGWAAGGGHEGGQRMG